MKPAIFNTEMVRAILDGRKTQTRRVCKVQPRHNDVYAEQSIHDSEHWTYLANRGESLHDYLEKPPYKVGDIIYVRETWNHTANESDLLDHEPRNKIGGRFIVYRADGEQIHPIHGKSIWKPSIHMPKEYARLFLRVKDVRIERLNEISEEDAEKEGIKKWDCVSGIGRRFYAEHNGYIFEESTFSRYSSSVGVAKRAFKLLWESIYGDGSFDNRYVWVTEFERISKEEAIKND